MSRRLVSGCLLCLALWSLWIAEAPAAPPRYLILQTPTPPSHHSTFGFFPGQKQPVTTNAYSYGYFGAMPRQHPQRSFGNNLKYTQWRFQ